MVAKHQMTSCDNVTSSLPHVNKHRQPDRSSRHVYPIAGGEKGGDLEKLAHQRRRETLNEGFKTSEHAETTSSDCIETSDVK